MEKKKKRLGYVLIIPSVAVLLIVLLFPLLYGLYLSFFGVVLGRSGGMYFKGFGNYVEVLTDPSWWHAFFVTSTFALADIFIGIPLGLAAALVLNKIMNSRTNNLLRAVIFSCILLPYVLPPITNALMWKWIYEPNGFLNLTLLRFGIIKNSIGWILSPKLALPSMIVANLWQGTPFATIIFFAGMKSIPSDIYEAAKIDGSSNWGLLRFITLPLLKPFVSLLVIMKTVLTFRIFGLIYAVTGGGPASSTNVVALKIYNTTFVSYHFGKASAMSYTLLIIVALVVLLYQKIFPSEEALL